MIFGIGTDICQVNRFEKWLLSPQKEAMLKRFFNPEEICNEDTEKINELCQHYAARFAAKEAFGKALGTGIRDFSLNEIYIKNDSMGKPVLMVQGNALKKLKELAGENAVLHVSLSHEKEYAVAFVTIERG